MRRQLVFLAAIAATCTSFVVSGCTTVDGEPSTASPNNTGAATTGPVEIRQTDDEGRALPFKTEFPNRWSKNNDGSSYEPCTAVTSRTVAQSNLDPRSVRDAATADFQTARGCRWTVANIELASLSQYVGNDVELDLYKKRRQAFTDFRPDVAINGRRVVVFQLNPSMCTTVVQSGRALVFTSATMVMNPGNAPCDKAIAFTRATINEIPE